MVDLKALRDKNGVRLSDGWFEMEEPKYNRIDFVKPWEKETIMEWIKQNLLPRKTVNNSYNSYGLKHHVEYDTGIYMNNNQFKDAMLEAGWIPYDCTELNWKYCLSQKSSGVIGGISGGFVNVISSKMHDDNSTYGTEGSAEKRLQIRKDMDMSDYDIPERMDCVLTNLRVYINDKLKTVGYREGLARRKEWEKRTNNQPRDAFGLFLCWDALHKILHKRVQMCFRGDSKDCFDMDTLREELNNLKNYIYLYYKETDEKTEDVIHWLFKECEVLEAMN